jgi:hypothetical protein
MTVIIDRAILRGELPPHTDATAVLLAVTGPIYYRLFIGEQPSQAIADSAGATAAAAARTGALAGPAAQWQTAVRPPGQGISWRRTCAWPYCGTAGPWGGVIAALARILA